MDITVSFSPLLLYLKPQTFHWSYCIQWGCIPTLSSGVFCLFVCLFVCLFCFVLFLCFFAPQEPELQKQIQRGEVTTHYNNEALEGPTSQVSERLSGDTTSPANMKLLR